MWKLSLVPLASCAVNEHIRVIIAHENTRLYESRARSRSIVLFGFAPPPPHRDRIFIGSSTVDVFANGASSSTRREGGLLSRCHSFLHRKIFGTINI
jgi:hypothetical protein